MSRYARLSYVALNASDPERTARFYRDEVGLEFVAGGTDGSLRLRSGDGRYHVALYASPRPGLKRMAFEMAGEGAFDALVERLVADQIPLAFVSDAECCDLKLERAFRISEPVTGAVIEFHEAVAGSRQPAFQPTLANIQRLGHLVLKSPDWPRTVAFFRDTLGFSVSDIIEDRVCFMRCTPNPFHHSIGIGAGESGLHHVNFMVTEIDDIGRAIHRFRRDGVDVVAGPGRHPTSNSIFLYFLDPDGLTVEYSFGMEEFPEAAPREHRVFPAVPESQDSWGSGRDPRHGASGEIEQMDMGRA